MKATEENGKSKTLRKKLNSIGEDKEEAGNITIDTLKNDRLYNLYKEGKFSDFSMICNEKEFQVHKCILATSSSDFFQRLFLSDWKEAETGFIEVPEGISHQAFELFIIYLYTLQMETEAMKQYIFELYELSDYFQAAELKKSIFTELNRYLSLENVRHCLKWFRKQNDFDLEDIFVDFVVNNAVSLAMQNFPFHGLGKIMINKVFQKQAQNATGGGGTTQTRESPIKRRGVPVSSYEFSPAPGPSRTNASNPSLDQRITLPHPSHSSSSHIPLPVPHQTVVPGNIPHQPGPYDFEVDFDLDGDLDVFDDTVGGGGGMADY
jgi:hypothetical protein